MVIILLTLAINTNAQIILTSASYPASVIGTDTLKVATTTSALPSFAAMANGIWDLSIITDSVPLYYAYRVPSATYQFADSNFYNFASYTYQGNVQSSIVSSGILEYATNVHQAGYSLTAVTSGPTDSLIVSAQSVVYSSPRTKIVFPATNLTTWSSVYHFDFNFDISVALASLNHAPGKVRTYTSETDSVIGWGKMRVKNLIGGVSNWYNVLQVKTVIITVDSFSLQGSFSNPLLSTILGALGLTQGQITKTYEQNYYRPMEVTPFVNVQFTDSTYATPKKVTTHTQRLVDVSVSEADNEQAINIYPNPVKSSKVTISLPTATGSWSYELVNMNGQILADGNITATGTQPTITMPAAIAPGIYYVRMNNNGKQYCVKAIEVIR